MTVEYTPQGLLRGILEELQAVRKLLENKDGDVCQVKAGGIEYHLNGFSAEETARILNELKKTRL